ncbi:MAG: hypothetical protein JNK24_03640 [Alphaproteobacteria bacterium]|nr:hypothetical protein [Alphaproteobacteria bacterium]
MELKSEIMLTPSARDHLCAMSHGYAGLRLTIRGGRGCGGSEYDLAPVSEADIDPQDDYIRLISGEPIPAQDQTQNPPSYPKLFIPSLDILKFFGMKIDYIEDQLGNRRLEITNPNESGRCGCGQSVTF